MAAPPPATVIEEAWQVTAEQYPYFTLKNIDWNAIHASYEARAKATRGDEILVLLRDLLGELRDGHVWFYTSGGMTVKTFTPPRVVKDRNAFSLAVVQHYFDNPLNSAGKSRIFYGALPGNIGYLYMTTFKRDESRWYFDLANVIADLGATRGLILDVRQNGGGSDVISNYLVSFFLEQPIATPPVVDARGDTLPRGLNYPVMKGRYLKPVIVLQNGVCFSATEGFINVIRQVPTVRTLGDTTAGGTGAPQDFPIAGGFVLHISTRAELNYQGGYIEKYGLVPDILVGQTEQDVRAGRDRQLEYAIQLVSQS